MNLKTNLMYHAPGLGVLFVLLSAVIWRWIPPWEFATHLQTMDSIIAAWVLDWGRYALLTDATYFDANIYSPLDNALATTVHLFLPTLLSFFAAIFTGNPIIIFNILFVTFYYANGLCTYLLTFEWTGRRAASVLAAVIFAFTPALLHHLNGQLHILSAWMIPLGLWCAWRWLRHGGWLRLLILYLLLQAAFLTDWYIAVLVSLTVGMFFLAFLVRGVQTKDWDIYRRLAAVAAAGLLSLLISIPLAIPYFEMQDQMPSTSFADIRSGSGKWYAYLLPPTGYDFATIGGVVSEMAIPMERRSPYPQHGGFVTYLLFLCSIILMTPPLRKIALNLLPKGVECNIMYEHRRKTYLAAVLAFVGVVFSLGPFLVAAGNVIYLPYAVVISALPELSFFRAPFRYNLLGILGMALAGALLVSSIRDKRKYRLVVCAVLTLAVVELYPIRLTNSRVSFDTKEAEVFYSHVSKLEKEAPLLEFPASTVHSMFYAMFHHRPIINGTSGYDPVYRYRKLLTLDNLPDPPAIWLLNSMQVRDVAVHDRSTADVFATSPYFDELISHGRHSYFRLNEAGLAQRPPEATDGHVPLVWDFTEKVLVDKIGPYQSRRLPNTSPEQTGLVLEILGSDPSIVLPPLKEFDGIDYPVLEVEIAAEGLGAETVQGTLYWTSREFSSWGEINAVSFVYPADGNLQKVRMNISERNMAWLYSTRIENVRFDPTTAFPGTVRIESLRLLPP